MTLTTGLNERFFASFVIQFYCTYNMVQRPFLMLNDALYIILDIFYTSLGGLHSIFRTKEKQEVLNSKRHMHRSLKFFGRPFGRSDSFSEDEDARGTHKSVHFKVKLFEL